MGLTNSLEQPEADVTRESLLDDQTSLAAPTITLVETIESPIIIEEIFLPAVPAIPAAEPIRIQAEAASEISEQPMKFNPEPSFSEPEAAISTTNGNVPTDSAPPELPVETIPEIEVSVAKSSRTKKTTTPDPLPTVITEEAPLDEATVPIAEPPLSVTDMIPMINMELKRLGWSKDRGREYMVSLYNKRASALLSDEELFGLLQHLKAEPII